MVKEKKIGRLQKKHAAQERNFQNDGLAATLETYNGRRFVWWLLSEGGMFRDPFNGHALDTAHACGRASVSRDLLNRVLEVNPEAYIQMMKENEAVERDRARELAELQADHEEGWEE